VNPESGAAGRRHDMNRFMTRLIFCLFTENTDIVNGKGLFNRSGAEISRAEDF
jgi:hypothetical protein